MNHALIIHRADSVPLDVVDLRRAAIAAAEDIDHDFPGLSADDLQLDLPLDEVNIKGDTLSLIEACKNLVANALRHGALPVTIAVRVEGDQAVLAVQDAGPGMPPEHWADAGTRYARRASVSPTKVGLGLSIVDAVARAHNGSMSFGRTAAETFEACISLPLFEGHCP